ncbi:MAG: Ppx/GppA family phosphatase [bacterium]|nr:Ppx/GppA family phosphatase [bacterium]
MNSEKLAAIDLGTNSFHLVVVRVLENGKIEIIADEKEAVRLGSGGGDLGLIAEDAMQRGLATLDRFVKIARSHDARIRAVATSAVREARNKKNFLNLVRKKLGLDIEVIQGTEEARLIYLGILQALPLYEKKILIVDIGGGSTEILIGTAGQPNYAVSRKLGAIRLKDRFFADEPLKPADVEKCRNMIRVDLSGVVEDLHEIGFEIAVGSSGTAETLATMATHLASDSESEAQTAADEDEAQGSALNSNGSDLADVRLTRAGLDRVVEKIVSVPTHHRRAKLSGLDEKRADIIVGGAILLQEIFDLLNIQEMLISPYALREGVVADTVARRSGGRSVTPDIRRNSVRQLADHMLGRDTQENRSAWHTATLAVRILDQLAAQGVIQSDALELNDSLLLEVAGVLHNLGLQIAHSGHHKHSYYIIKNTDALLGFTRNEIEVIAQTARYHRKALPSSKHSEYTALTPELQERVKLFSAILRIAVGLDRGNKQSVENLTIELDGDSLIFQLTPRHDFPARPRDLSLERWAAEARADALKKVLGKSIVFREA